MAETLQELTIKIMGKQDPSLNNVLGATEKAFKQKFDNIRRHAQQAAAAFAGIAVGLIAVGKSAVDTATDFEYMQRKMEIVNGSTEEANRLFGEMIQLSKDSGNFTLEQLVSASNAMENFSDGSSKALRGLTAIAEVLDADIVSSARNVGRAIQGDSRAFLVLRNQLGITEDKLKEFDSAFDETGKNAVQNGEILLRYLMTFEGNMGGIADTLQSELGDVQVEISQLAAEYGKILRPEVKELANTVEEYVVMLRNMSDEERENIVETGKLALKIAAGAAAFFTFVSIAATVIEKLVILKTFIAATFTPAIIAMGAAIAAAAAPFLALAADIQDAINKMDMFSEHEQEMLNISDKTYVAFRKFRRGEALSSQEASRAISYVMDLRRQELKEQKNGWQDRIVIYDSHISKLKQISAEAKETEQDLKSMGKAVSLMGVGGITSIVGMDAAETQQTTKAVEDQVQARRDLIDNYQKAMDLDRLSMAQKTKLVNLLYEESQYLYDTADTAEDAAAQREEAHKIHVQGFQLEKQLIQEVADENAKAADKMAKDAESVKQAKVKAAQDAATAQEKSISKVLSDESFSFEERKEFINEWIDWWKNAEQTRVVTSEEATSQIEDLNQKLVDVNKQYANDLKSSQQSLMDEIAQLTLDQTQLEEYEFQKRLAQYSKFKENEGLIAELIEARKQAKMKETTKTATAETKKMVDDLEQRLQRLRQSRLGGAASPLMSVEELGVQSAAQFARVKTASFDNPVGNVAGAQTASMSAAQTQESVKNYIVNIGDITVTGEQAKKIVEDLNGIEGVNRSFSVQ